MGADPQSARVRSRLSQLAFLGVAFDFLLRNQVDAVFAEYAGMAPATVLLACTLRSTRSLPLFNHLSHFNGHLPRHALLQQAKCDSPQSMKAQYYLLIKALIYREIAHDIPRGGVEKRG